MNDDEAGVHSLLAHMRGQAVIRRRRSDGRIALMLPDTGWTVYPNVATAFAVFKQWKKDKHEPDAQVCLINVQPHECISQ